MSLTWDDVASWRLRRHHLHERARPGGLVGVVSRVCGLHAQLMSSAELSAWARVDRLEADAVASALWQDRSLVKTWAMRGTLHLLPAAEYPMWRAALGTYRHYRKPALTSSPLRISIREPTIAGEFRVPINRTGQPTGI